MIRIATWNVAGTGEAAWTYVVSTLPADIILLQECRDPAAYLSANVYKQNGPCIRWEPNNDKRGKGIAIYTRGLRLDTIPFRHHPGWAQIADVTIGNGPGIRLINVHGEVQEKLLHYRYIEYDYGRSFSIDASQHLSSPRGRPERKLIVRGAHPKSSTQNLFGATRK